MIVGVVTASLLGIESSRFIFIIVYGGLLGTLIDLDHFIVARFNIGNWSVLKRAVSNPSMMIFRQELIFSGGVGKIRRLFSHMIVGGVIIGILSVVDYKLMIFSAVILYTHVLSDMYSDIRELNNFVTG